MYRNLICKGKGVITSRRRKGLFPRTVKRFVASVLVLQYFFSLNLWQLHAQVPAGSGMQVDRSGGPSASVRNSGGTHIVDIVKPNASGLSHNRFRSFNVGRGGAVMNNSVRGGRSALGGQLGANAGLSGSSARIILNEVTGGGRSMLRGQTEIFGQRAEYVLANPNGISCDGCGFMNASRATLTTGRSVFDTNQGSLRGFEVNGGDVSIEGAGLHGGDTDFFDIITQSVTIDARAEVRGGLSLVLGKNLVSYDSGQVEEVLSTDVGSGVALDVSALGGVRAGDITMESSGRGSGVRVAGNMASSAGGVRFTADGKMVMSGNVTARGGSVKLKSHSGDVVLGSEGSFGTIVRSRNGGVLISAAGGSVVNHGSVIEGHRGLEIIAKQDIQNKDGGYLSGGSVTVLEAKEGNVVNEDDGLILSNRWLDVKAGGDIVNQGGTLSSGVGWIQLNAEGSVRNEDWGQIEGIQGVSISSGEDIGNSYAHVFGGGSVVLASSRDVESEGRWSSVKSVGSIHVDAERDVSIDAGLFASGGNIVINAGRDARIGREAALKAFDSNYINANNNLENSGVLLAGKQVYVEAQEGDVLNNGRIEVGTVDILSVLLERYSGSNLIPQTRSELRGMLSLSENTEKIQEILDSVVAEGGDVAIPYTASEIKEMFTSDAPEEIEQGTSGDDIIVIRSGGKISNEEGGSLLASNVTLFADNEGEELGGVVNRGLIDASGALSVSVTGGDIKNIGGSLLGGSVSLRVEASLPELGGASGEGAIEGVGGFFENSGHVRAKANPAVEGSGSLVVEAERGFMSDGGSLIASVVFLRSEKGNIEVAGGSLIEGRKSLSLSAGATIADSGDSEGQVEFDGRVSIAGDETIVRGDYVSINATGAILNSGARISGKNLQLDSQKVGFSNVNGGVIEGDLGVHITAGSLDYDKAGEAGAILSSAGIVNELSSSIISKGYLVMEASGGEIENNGSLSADSVQISSLTGHGISNAGEITSGSQVMLSAGLEVLKAEYKQEILAGVTTALFQLPALLSTDKKVSINKKAFSQDASSEVNRLLVHLEKKQRETIEKDEYDAIASAIVKLKEIKTSLASAGENKKYKVAFSGQIDNSGGRITSRDTVFINAIGEEGLIRNVEGRIDTFANDASTVLLSGGSLDARESVFSGGSLSLSARGDINAVDADVRGDETSFLQIASSEGGVLASGSRMSMGAIRIQAQEGITINNTRLSSTATRRQLAQAYGIDRLENEEGQDLIPDAILVSSQEGTIRGQGGAILGNGVGIHAGQEEGASAGSVDLQGFNLGSYDSRSVKVLSKNSINLDNSSLFSDAVHLDANDTSLSGVNMSVVARDFLQLGAKTDVTLDNSVVMGGVVRVNAEKGHLFARNSSLGGRETSYLSVSAGGEASEAGSGQVSIVGASVRGDIVYVKANAGDLSADNAIIQGADYVNLFAGSREVPASDAKQSSVPLDVAFSGSVHASGAKITSGGNVSIEALSIEALSAAESSEGGSVFAVGANVTSLKGLNIDASHDINLSSGRLSGLSVSLSSWDDVNITNATVEATGSRRQLALLYGIESPEGEDGRDVVPSALRISSRSGSVLGSNSNLQGDGIQVIASNGSIDVESSTLGSRFSRSVSLVSNQNLSLSHSNVNANSILLNTTIGAIQASSARVGDHTTSLLQAVAGGADDEGSSVNFEGSFLSGNVLSLSAQHGDLLGDDSILVAGDTLFLKTGSLVQLTEAESESYHADIRTIMSESGVDFDTDENGGTNVRVALSNALEKLKERLESVEESAENSELVALSAAIKKLENKIEAIDEKTSQVAVAGSIQINNAGLFSTKSVSLQGIGGDISGGGANIFGGETVSLTSSNHLNLADTSLSGSIVTLNGAERIDITNARINGRANRKQIANIYGMDASDEATVVPDSVRIISSKGSIEGAGASVSASGLLVHAAMAIDLSSSEIKGRNESVNLFANETVDIGGAFVSSRSMSVSSISGSVLGGGSLLAVREAIQIRGLNEVNVDNADLKGKQIHLASASGDVMARGISIESAGANSQVYIEASEFSEGQKREIAQGLASHLEGTGIYLDRFEKDNTAFHLVGSSSLESILAQLEKKLERGGVSGERRAKIEAAIVAVKGYRDGANGGNVTLDESSLVGFGHISIFAKGGSIFNRGSVLRAKNNVNLKAGVYASLSQKQNNSYADEVKEILLDTGIDVSEELADSVENGYGIERVLSLTMQKIGEKEREAKIANDRDTLEDTLDALSGIRDELAAVSKGIGKKTSDIVMSGSVELGGSRLSSGASASVESAGGVGSGIYAVASHITVGDSLSMNGAVRGELDLSSSVLSGRVVNLTADRDVILSGSQISGHASRQEIANLYSMKNEIGEDGEEIADFKDSEGRDMVPLSVRISSAGIGGRIFGKSAGIVGDGVFLSAEKGSIDLGGLSIDGLGSSRSASLVSKGSLNVDGASISAGEIVLNSQKSSVSASNGFINSREKILIESANGINIENSQVVGDAISVSTKRGDIKGKGSVLSQKGNGEGDALSLFSQQGNIDIAGSSLRAGRGVIRADGGDVTIDGYDASFRNSIAITAGKEREITQSEFNGFRDNLRRHASSVLSSDEVDELLPATPEADGGATSLAQVARSAVYSVLTKLKEKRKTGELGDEQTDGIVSSLQSALSNIETTTTENAGSIIGGNGARTISGGSIFLKSNQGEQASSGLISIGQWDVLSAGSRLDVVSGGKLVGDGGSLAGAFVNLQGGSGVELKNSDIESRASRKQLAEILGVKARKDSEGNDIADFRDSEGRDLVGAAVRVSSERGDINLIGESLGQSQVIGDGIQLSASLGSVVGTRAIFGVADDSRYLSITSHRDIDVSNSSFQVDSLTLSSERGGVDAHGVVSHIRNAITVLANSDINLDNAEIFDLRGGATLISRKGDISGRSLHLGDKASGVLSFVSQGEGGIDLSSSELRGRRGYIHAKGGDVTTTGWDVGVQDSFALMAGIKTQSVVSEGSIISGGEDGSISAGGSVYIKTTGVSSDMDLSGLTVTSETALNLIADGSANLSGGEFTGGIVNIAAIRDIQRSDSTIYATASRTRIAEITGLDLHEDSDGNPIEDYRDIEGNDLVRVGLSISSETGSILGVGGAIMGDGIRISAMNGEINLSNTAFQLEKEVGSDGHIKYVGSGDSRSLVIQAGGDINMMGTTGGARSISLSSAEGEIIGSGAILEFDTSFTAVSMNDMNFDGASLHGDGSIYLKSKADGITAKGADLSVGRHSTGSSITAVSMNGMNFDGASLHGNGSIYLKSEADSVTAKDMVSHSRYLNITGHRDIDVSASSFQGDSLTLSSERGRVDAHGVVSRLRNAITVSANSGINLDNTEIFGLSDGATFISRKGNISGRSLRLGDKASGVLSFISEEEGDIDLSSSELGGRKGYIHAKGGDVITTGWDVEAQASFTLIAGTKRELSRAEHKGFLVNLGEVDGLTALLQEVGASEEGSGKTASLALLEILSRPSTVSGGDTDAEDGEETTNALQEAQKALAILKNVYAGLQDESLDEDASETERTKAEDDARKVKGMKTALVSLISDIRAQSVVSEGSIISGGEEGSISAGGSVYIKTTGVSSDMDLSGLTVTSETALNLIVDGSANLSGGEFTGGIVNIVAIRDIQRSDSTIYATASRTRIAELTGLDLYEDADGNPIEDYRDIEGNDLVRAGLSISSETGSILGSGGAIMGNGIRISAMNGEIDLSNTAFQLEEVGTRNSRSLVIQAGGDINMMGTTGGARSIYLSSVDGEIIGLDGALLEFDTSFTAVSMNDMNFDGASLHGNGSIYLKSKAGSITAEGANFSVDRYSTESSIRFLAARGNVDIDNADLTGKNILLKTKSKATMEGATIDGQIFVEAGSKRELSAKEQKDFTKVIISALEDTLGVVDSDMKKRLLGSFGLVEGLENDLDGDGQKESWQDSVRKILNKDNILTFLDGVRAVLSGVRDGVEVDEKIEEIVAEARREKKKGLHGSMITGIETDGSMSEFVKGRVEYSTSIEAGSFTSIETDGSIFHEADGSVSIDTDGYTFLETDGSMVTEAVMFTRTSIETDGSTSIEVDGSTSIEAGGPMAISIEEDGSTSIEVDGSITIDIDGSESIETDGTILVAADGSISIEAGSFTSIETDGSIFYEADGSISIDTDSSESALPILEGIIANLESTGSDLSDLLNEVVVEGSLSARGAEFHLLSGEKSHLNVAGKADMVGFSVVGGTDSSFTVDATSALGLLDHDTNINMEEGTLSVITDDSIVNNLNLSASSDSRLGSLSLKSRKGEIISTGFRSAGLSQGYYLEAAGDISLGNGVLDLQHLSIDTGGEIDFGHTRRYGNNKIKASSSLSITQNATIDIKSLNDYVLVASDNLSLESRNGSILNDKWGGIYAGESLSLTAKKNVENIGGRIVSDGSFSLRTDGDFINEATCGAKGYGCTAAKRPDRRPFVGIDRQAIVEVKGDANIRVGGDLKNISSSFVAKNTFAFVKGEFTNETLKFEREVDREIEVERSTSSKSGATTHKELVTIRVNEEYAGPQATFGSRTTAGDEDSGRLTLISGGDYANIGGQIKGKDGNIFVGGEQTEKSLTLRARGLGGVDYHKDSIGPKAEYRFASGDLNFAIAGDQHLTAHSMEATNISQVVGGTRNEFQIQETEYYYEDHGAGKHGANESKLQTQSSEASVERASGNWQLIVQGDHNSEGIDLNVGGNAYYDVKGDRNFTAVMNHSFAHTSNGGNSSGGTVNRDKIRWSTSDWNIAGDAYFRVGGDAVDQGLNYDVGGHLTREFAGVHLSQGVKDLDGEETSHSYESSSGWLFSSTETGGARKLKLDETVQKNTVVSGGSQSYEVGGNGVIKGEDWVAGGKIKVGDIELRRDADGKVMLDENGKPLAVLGGAGVSGHLVFEDMKEKHISEKSSWRHKSSGLFGGLLTYKSKQTRDKRNDSYETSITNFIEGNQGVFMNVAGVLGVTNTQITSENGHVALYGGEGVNLFAGVDTGYEMDYHFEKSSGFDLLGIVKAAVGIALVATGYGMIAAAAIGDAEIYKVEGTTSKEGRFTKTLQSSTVDSKNGATVVLSGTGNIILEGGSDIRSEIATVVQSLEGGDVYQLGGVDTILSTFHHQREEKSFGVSFSNPLITIAKTVSSMGNSGGGASGGPSTDVANQLRLSDNSTPVEISPSTDATNQLRPSDGANEPSEEEERGEVALFREALREQQASNHQVPTRVNKHKGKENIANGLNLLSSAASLATTVQKLSNIKNLSDMASVFSNGLGGGSIGVSYKQSQTETKSGQYQEKVNLSEITSRSGVAFVHVNGDDAKVRGIGAVVRSGPGKETSIRGGKGVGVEYRAIKEERWGYRQTEGSGFGVSLSMNVGGSGGSGGLNMNESNQDFQMSGHNWVESSLGGVGDGSKLSVISGGDIVLAGATGVAEDISVQVGVGGKLRVETLLNEHTSDLEGDSFGIGINAGTGGGQTNIGGNLSLGETDGSGSSRWADGPSGFFATDGGSLDIRAGSIELIGGTLAQLNADGSDGGNVSIATDSITSEDLQMHDYSDFTSWNAGISGSVSSSSTLPTITGGFAGAGHDKQGVLRASIGKGTITKLDGTVYTDEELGDLNRDVSKILTITKNEEQENVSISATLDTAMVIRPGEFFEPLVELPGNIRKGFANLGDIFTPEPVQAENGEGTLTPNFWTKDNLITMGSAVFGAALAVSCGGCEISAGGGAILGGVLAVELQGRTGEGYNIANVDYETADGQVTRGVGNVYLSSDDGLLLNGGDIDIAANFDFTKMDNYKIDVAKEQLTNNPILQKFLTPDQLAGFEENGAQVQVTRAEFKAETSVEEFLDGIFGKKPPEMIVRNVEGKVWLSEDEGNLRQLSEEKPALDFFLPGHSAGNAYNAFRSFQNGEAYQTNFTVAFDINTALFDHSDREIGVIRSLSREEREERSKEELAIIAHRLAEAEGLVKQRSTTIADLDASTYHPDDPDAIHFAKKEKQKLPMASVDKSRAEGSVVFYDRQIDLLEGEIERNNNREGLGNYANILNVNFNNDGNNIELGGDYSIASHISTGVNNGNLDGSIFASGFFGGRYDMGEQSITQVSFTTLGGYNDVDGTSINLGASFSANKLPKEGMGWDFKGTVHHGNGKITAPRVDSIFANILGGESFSTQLLGEQETLDVNLRDVAFQGNYKEDGLTGRFVGGELNLTSGRGEQQATHLEFSDFGGDFDYNLNAPEGKLPVYGNVYAGSITVGGDFAKMILENTVDLGDKAGKLVDIAIADGGTQATNFALSLQPSKNNSGFKLNASADNLRTNNGSLDVNGLTGGFDSLTGIFGVEAKNYSVAGDLAFAAIEALDLDEKIGDVGDVGDVMDAFVNKPGEGSDRNRIYGKHLVVNGNMTKETVAFEQAELRFGEGENANRFTGLSGSFHSKTGEGHIAYGSHFINKNTVEALSDIGKELVDSPVGDIMDSFTKSGEGDSTAKGVLVAWGDDAVSRRLKNPDAEGERSNGGGNQVFASVAEATIGGNEFKDVLYLGGYRGIDDQVSVGEYTLDPNAIKDMEKAVRPLLLSGDKLDKMGASMGASIDKFMEALVGETSISGRGFSYSKAGDEIMIRNESLVSQGANLQNVVYSQDSKTGDSAFGIEGYEFNGETTAVLGEAGIEFLESRPSTTKDGNENAVGNIVSALTTGNGESGVTGTGLSVDFSKGELAKVQNKTLNISENKFNEIVFTKEAGTTHFEVGTYTLTPELLGAIGDFAQKQISGGDQKYSSAIEKIANEITNTGKNGVEGAGFALDITGGEKIVIRNEKLQVGEGAEASWVNGLSVEYDATRKQLGDVSITGGAQLNKGASLATAELLDEVLGPKDGQGVYQVSVLREDGSLKAVNGERGSFAEALGGGVISLDTLSYLPSEAMNEAIVGGAKFGGQKVTGAMKVNWNGEGVTGAELLPLQGEEVAQISLDGKGVALVNTLLSMDPTEQERTTITGNPVDGGLEVTSLSYTSDAMSISIGGPFTITKLKDNPKPEEEGSGEGRELTHISGNGVGLKILPEGTDEIGQTHITSLNPDAPMHLMVGDLDQDGNNYVPGLDVTLEALSLNDKGDTVMQNIEGSLFQEDSHGVAVEMKIQADGLVVSESPSDGITGLGFLGNYALEVSGQAGGEILGGEVKIGVCKGSGCAGGEAVSLNEVSMLMDMTGHENLSSQLQESFAAIDDVNVDMRATPLGWVVAGLGSVAVAAGVSTVGVLKSTAIAGIGGYFGWTAADKKYNSLTAPDVDSNGLSANERAYLNLGENMDGLRKDIGLGAFEPMGITPFTPYTEGLSVSNGIKNVKEFGSDVKEFGINSIEKMKEFGSDVKEIGNEYFELASLTVHSTLHSLEDKAYAMKNKTESFIVNTFDSLEDKASVMKNKTEGFILNTLYGEGRDQIADPNVAIIIGMNDKSEGLLNLESGKPVVIENEFGGMSVISLEEESVPSALPGRYESRKFAMIETYTESDADGNEGPRSYGDGFREFLSRGLTNVGLRGVGNMLSPGANPELEQVVRIDITDIDSLEIQSGGGTDGAPVIKIHGESNLTVQDNGAPSAIFGFTPPNEDDLERTMALSSEGGMAVQLGRGGAESMLAMGGSKATINHFSVGLDYGTAVVDLYGRENVETLGDLVLNFDEDGSVVNLGATGSTRSTHYLATEELKLPESDEIKNMSVGRCYDCNGTGGIDAPLASAVGLAFPASKALKAGIVSLPALETAATISLRAGMVVASENASKTATDMNEFNEVSLFSGSGSLEAKWRTNETVDDLSATANAYIGEPIVASLAMVFEGIVEMNAEYERYSSGYYRSDAAGNHAINLPIHGKSNEEVFFSPDWVQEMRKEMILENPSLGGEPSSKKLNASETLNKQRAEEVWGEGGFEGFVENIGDINFDDDDGFGDGTDFSYVP